jgi:AraC-like DNA-binding protein
VDLTQKSVHTFAMVRALEASGIGVERNSHGLAVRIQTPTERALIVVEGRALCQHGTLPSGTLLIERRELTGGKRQYAIDLIGERAEPALMRCFELLASELSATAVDVRVVRGLCEVVLGLATRTARLGTDARTESTHVDAARDLCVRKALGLLASRLSERWTVERLARELGLSRAALARRFGAATGTSPLRYLAEARIAEAERLLLESDASLSEIARRVGYESEFAFNRAFKRLRGVAPGQFRRSLGVGRGPVMTLAA